MATILLNKKLKNDLTGVLDPAQLQALQRSLDTISALSPKDQGLVARIYTSAFNEQMRICTYLCAAALIAAVATYQKAPASVAAMKDRQDELLREVSNDDVVETTDISAMSAPVLANSVKQEAEAQ